MKKKLLPLFALLFFATAHAQAQESCNEESCCAFQPKLYAKAFGGVNFLRHTTLNDNNASYDTGYIAGGAVGYSWDCGLRLEAEYAYRRNSIKHIAFFIEGDSNLGHTQCSSFMGNIYWDFPSLCWNIKPFIGAGLGYDLQEMHSENDRIIFFQDWNNLSWQVMVGLSYPIFCNTELYLEYKFHQGASDFWNHAICLGLTYTFD